MNVTRTYARLSVGDRVEYIGGFNNYYAPYIGAIGKILSIDYRSNIPSAFIQWATQVNKGDGKWWCPLGCVQLVEEPCNNPSKHSKEELDKFFSEF